MPRAAACSYKGPSPSASFPGDPLSSCTSGEGGCRPWSPGEGPGLERKGEPRLFVNTRAPPL